MTETTPETLITVSIAKMGQPITDVKVPVGSNVKAALVKGGFNIDSILSIKRNGEAVTIDTTLVDGNVLLISMEKIKGGNDEAQSVSNASSEGELLRLKFDIVKEGSASGDYAFSTSESTFSIIKSVVRAKGQSMNNFKRLVDANGTEVSLTTQLTTGFSYKIVMESNEADEDYDD